MQAYGITKSNKKKLKKSLHRGSICKVDFIKFDLDDGTAAKISGFYPHIEFDGINYAIILNHSCSLSREHKGQCTSLYLNLGFLEPLEKLLSKNFTRKIIININTQLSTDMSIKDKYEFILEQFKSGYTPGDNSSLVDSGVLIPGVHCLRADDNANNPMPASADCLHWKGQAPDIGAFER